MEDFFGDSGETAVQQEFGQAHFQSQDNAPDDQFEFSGILCLTQNPTIILQQKLFSSLVTLQHHLILKLFAEYRKNKQKSNKCLDKKQQEMMIIQNVQYQEKQKRKDEGRRQYEQFLAKKEKQTSNRKLENVEKQKQLIERNAKLSQEAGWKKVAANVALKQGENKGQKDITRMRESIINKRNDESN